MNSDGIVNTNWVIYNFLATLYYTAVLWKHVICFPTTVIVYVYMYRVRALYVPCLCLVCAVLVPAQFAAHLPTSGYEVILFFCDLYIEIEMMIDLSLSLSIYIYILVFVCVVTVVCPVTKFHMKSRILQAIFSFQLWNILNNCIFSVASY